MPSISPNLSPSSSLGPPINEVTRILSAIDSGDPHAAEKLLPMVYDELRKLAAAKLAQEKPGQTHFGGLKTCRHNAFRTGSRRRDTPCPSTPNVFKPCS
jgi:hypothetical protein